jgi:hypothetical protein
VTILAILVLAGATALGVFFLWIRSKRRAGLDEAEINAKMSAVDLEAFRNLVDPEEEQYLRENLPAADFRAVQRERLVAALDYVGGLSQNASLLLQLGQVAKSSPDPRVAEAGQHIVDNAVRLRFYAVMVKGRLYAKIAFPTAKLEPAGVLSHYQEVSNWAALLGRLQHPAESAVVARAL